jgi:hypothetical protein
VLDQCDPPTIYWFSIMTKKDGGGSSGPDEVSTRDLGYSP